MRTFALGLSFARRPTSALGAWLAGVFVVTGGGGACSSPPPPPPKAPEAEAPPAEPEAPPTPIEEPVDLRLACVKGTSECGGGVCSVKIKNDCDNAVTCNVAVVTTCKMPAAMQEAAGRERTTLAAKSEFEMVVPAKCTDGEVMHTAIKSAECK